MTTTPTSEKTLYFDAPIICFQMSQSSPPPTDTATHVLPVEPFDGPIDVKETHFQDVSKDIPTTGAAPKETSSDANVEEGFVPKSAILASSPSSPPKGSPLSRNMFMNADGQQMDGSTFIGGAVTTGPNSTAEASDQLHRRAASADASLTPKQRSKINKAEGNVTPTQVYDVTI